MKDIVNVVIEVGHRFEARNEDEADHRFETRNDSTFPSILYQPPHLSTLLSAHYNQLIDEYTI